MGDSMGTGSYGRFFVHLADPEQVRGTSPALQEFGNFGHHWRFAEIPETQIWINQDLLYSEQAFYLHRALHEIKALASGIPLEAAKEFGEQAEAIEREKIDHLGKPGDKEEPDPQVYLSKYATLPGGEEVWNVDGCLIRDIHLTGFHEGGN